MDARDFLHHIIANGTRGDGEPRGSGDTGMHALMRAVLEDGARSFCGRVGRRRTEAETWVRSPQRAPFSFIVICEALGLDPDSVRTTLERLRNQSTPHPRRIRRNGRRHRSITAKSG